MKILFCAIIHETTENAFQPQRIWLLVDNRYSYFRFGLDISTQASCSSDSIPNIQSMFANTHERLIKFDFDFLFMIQFTSQNRLFQNWMNIDNVHQHKLPTMSTLSERDEWTFRWKRLSWPLASLLLILIPIMTFKKIMHEWNSALMRSICLMWTLLSIEAPTGLESLIEKRAGDSSQFFDLRAIKFQDTSKRSYVSA
jgi:hypothetical protein